MTHDTSLTNQDIEPTRLKGRSWSTMNIVLAVVTLSTNIASNVVSPANSISNISPSRISFLTGGLIAACLGILIMPWKILSSAAAYTFTWLIGYSALLGPIGGILIANPNLRT